MTGNMMLQFLRKPLLGLVCLFSLVAVSAPSSAADYPNRPVRWLIHFASSGNGTSVHMSAELFKVMTKCDMVHVPYRGSAIAFPDIISNKVQLIFDNLPSALEQARGGSVRALGVTSPQRWPSVPDVPAIAETVPGFESVGFYGISAPKGTPPDIVELLNKAVNEALKDPQLVARLAEVGGIPKPMTPAEFGKLVTDETEKW